MQTALFAIRALLTNPSQTSNPPRKNNEKPKSSKLTPYRPCYQSSLQRRPTLSRLESVRKKKTKINISRIPVSKSVDSSARDSALNSKDSRRDRVAKFEKLRSSESPFLALSFNPKHKTSDLRTLSGAQKDIQEDHEVRVAGRLISIEYNKDSTEMLILDEAGYLNVCLKNNEIVKEFADRGDLIGVVGTIQKSEIRKFELSAKSRQRYIDLIMNPQTREVFRARMKVTSAIRSFLEHRGYIEIDIPVLYPASGGADADPFLTRHDASDRSLTLRISPELHLKRMMVGGFERVFELGRIFRNEESSTRHNPVWQENWPRSVSPVKEII